MSKKTIALAFLSWWIFTRRCPNCDSDNLMSYHNADGYQMYRCLDCGNEW